MQCSKFRSNASDLLSALSKAGCFLSKAESVGVYRAFSPLTMRVSFSLLQG